MLLNEKVEAIAIPQKAELDFFDKYFPKSRAR